jgi:hypothetical protein
MSGVSIGGGLRAARWRCLAAGVLWTSIGVTFAAESDDVLAPFLGTWSGIFTTQDHASWRVEDFACFVGCPPEMRDYMVSLLQDRANDERPVSELLGRSYAFARDHLAALLTPLGRRIQEANSPETDPKLHCQPYGFVRQVTNPLPMLIERDGEHLLIRYEEWSLLRSIYMDGRAHPEHRTPTLLGHSVGRVEEGVLIVETARVTPDWYSDFTHAGHSGELSGVERYTVRDHPRRLELELTLEDPATLTKPYVITKTWLYTPDVELVQDQCAERPGRF